MSTFLIIFNLTILTTSTIICVSSLVELKNSQEKKMINVIKVNDVIDQEKFQKIKKLGSYFSIVITQKGIVISLIKDSPYFTHDVQVMKNLGFTEVEGSISRFTL